ncbi:helix-turn-helix domain-containing protein [Pseudalkalibacillus sp. R45]|uniref:helix-turn-helix domain-containing protein n=1 Tax=Pseudalkalibacillus sp. R45 TaxID=3457433 RepID=UPI003FCC57E5
MARVIKLRIKELLEEHDLTQLKLHEMSKVRQATISEMTRNVRVQVDIRALAKIADALEIDDINDLMTIEKE